MQELDLNLILECKPQSIDDLARSLYLNVHRDKSPKGWRKLLARQSRPLLDLARAEQEAHVVGRRYVGIQTVALRRIQGSEGRQGDFDADFHPLGWETAGRWMSIVRACYLGQALPPIELIRLGDTYYVRDGHHRVSVARALGQDEIDAQVIVWDVAPVSSTTDTSAHTGICFRVQQTGI